VEDDLMPRLNKRIEAIQKMPQRQFTRSESEDRFSIGHRNRDYFRKRTNEYRSKRKDERRRIVKRYGRRKR
jgi:hypothetical protein